MPGFSVDLIFCRVIPAVSLIGVLVALPWRMQGIGFWIVLVMVCLSVAGVGLSFLWLMLTWPDMSSS